MKEYKVNGETDPKEFAPATHQVKYELSEDGTRTLTYCPHGVANYYGKYRIDGEANRVGARPCLDCIYNQGVDCEAHEVGCSFTEGDDKELYFLN